MRIRSTISGIIRNVPDALGQRLIKRRTFERVDDVTDDAAPSTAATEDKRRTYKRRDMKPEKP